MQPRVAKPDDVIDVSDLDPALPRCGLIGVAARQVTWLCSVLCMTMLSQLPLLLPAAGRGSHTR
jgi:hypothetical protein